MEGVALDDRRIALERARGVWPERVATDYLDRWVAEKPDATALVAWRLEEEAETRLTYRELAARVAGTAAALERAGVRQGDRCGRPRGRPAARATSYRSSFRTGGSSWCSTSPRCAWVR